MAAPKGKKVAGMIKLQIAEIASFVEPDSRICAERRCQLTAAYVDREHFLAAALQ